MVLSALITGFKIATTNSFGTIHAYYGFVSKSSNVGTLIDFGTSHDLNFSRFEPIDRTKLTLGVKISCSNLQ